LRICVLLSKRRPRLRDVALDDAGFEIDDEFVVGYGMDYQGRFRNLPCIGISEPEQAVMKLRVLFFSVLRDITGADEIALELPAGSTMADLLHSNRIPLAQAARLAKQPAPRARSNLCEARGAAARRRRSRDHAAGSRRMITSSRP
jgi:hypothetical protein